MRVFLGRGDKKRNIIKIYITFSSDRRDQIDKQYIKEINCITFSSHSLFSIKHMNDLKQISVTVPLLHSFILFLIWHEN